LDEVIVVTEATPDDLPALESLLMALFSAMRDTAGLDRSRALKNCRALLGREDTHILIARAGGQAVGFINFTLRQTLLHPGPSGLVDELVVAEGWRGRGVGRRLVAAAIERCRQLGCCEVEVSTEKANRAARAFYRRCGFEEEAVLFELEL